MIVSTSNGLIIGEDWLCADDVEGDWYTTTYNDSHWQNARVTKNSVDRRFRPYAQWVWSQEYFEAETAVYCRGKIGK